MSVLVSNVLQFLTNVLDLSYFIPAVTAVRDFIWNFPLLFALVGTGIWVTFKMNFIQFRKIPYTFSLLFSGRRRRAGDVEKSFSGVQALFIMMGASIGTGAVVGVFMAILSAYPGAAVYIIIFGFINAPMKIVEIYSALSYRNDENGVLYGGPPYYIRNRCVKFWGLSAAVILANLYALGMAVGTLMSTPLIHSSAISTYWSVLLGVSPIAVGLFVTGVTLYVVVGGRRGLAQFMSSAVPFMVLFYVLAGIFVLFMRYDHIIPAVGTVLYSAWSPESAVAGVGGWALIKMYLNQISTGAARATYATESGSGSSGIANATVRIRNDDEKVEQALLGLADVFVVCCVCTLTVLVFVAGGGYVPGISVLDGMISYHHVFVNNVPFVGFLVLPVSLAVFGMTSICGCEYYGARSLRYYTSNETAMLIYRVVFCIFVMIGSVQSPVMIWLFADLGRVLVFVSNLPAIWWLAPEVKEAIDIYFRKNENVKKGVI